MLKFLKVLKIMKGTMPKVLVQDNQEVKPDSSNDIRSFFVIDLHDLDEILKLHHRYSCFSHHPMNELNE